MRGEHMRTCVLAHTETLPANKITKKIWEKQRWPSETKKGKNIRTVPMRTCVHVHTLKEITALGIRVVLEGLHNAKICVPATEFCGEFVA